MLSNKEGPIGREGVFSSRLDLLVYLDFVGCIFGCINWMWVCKPIVVLQDEFGFIYRVWAYKSIVVL